jgi:transposase
MRIRPFIAKEGTLHGSGLGQHRWVVERTLAWLHQFKKLRIRQERTVPTYQALTDLACCLICLRTLVR